MTPADAPSDVASPANAWPALPLDGWRATYETLHLWTQIVGKTRLALAPAENHWWHVALYVTPRGLTTAPMQVGERTFAVDFDFVDHRLRVWASDGGVAAVALGPQSVAQFHAAYVAALKALDITVAMRAVPNEVEVAIPFAEDCTHASYDPESATRWWRALTQADRVLKRFRGEFLGKSSPVHFFWGSFDLAHTRFSGRRAPAHPGGAPNCPAYVMVEAYSHECSSMGFWPGGGAIPEPAFYAYAYPEPVGYRDRRIEPAAAYFSRELGEFILPYDAVRRARDPDAMLIAFLQSAYEAAAELGHWDRAALERRRPESRA